MNTKTLSNILVAALIALSPSILWAHCEIPCGIYNDQARIDLILEHAQTIEKSMQSISSGTTNSAQDTNQLIRWVSNKEEHATKIQEIVSQYFLTQRIKVTDKNDKQAYAKYEQELTLLHQILVAAMKSKQTTDTTYVQEIRTLVKKFSELYLDHKH